MSSPWLYTFSDAQQYLLDWIGSVTTDASGLRRIRQAIEDAYRDVSMIRQWSYYATRGGPLVTAASYSTGTVQYTDATRVVTLTGGTFPSWAAFGVLRIGNVDAKIASLDSSTQVTVSVQTPFGKDSAAGTAYILYRDTYPLPVNVWRMGTVKDSNRMQTLMFVSPNEMIASRVTSQAPAVPWRYSIISDPHYVGSMAVMFYPAPANLEQYVYMYQRWPRQFTTPSYTTGTATTSTTTVTGTGTTWTSAMVGCVIRFSGDSINNPTGTNGSNPYSAQRIVTGFTSANSITIDAALSAELTGVKYEISDPVDLEAGAMYTAFLRRCEMELGQIFQRHDVDRLFTQYNLAMTLACEADSRSFDEKPGGMRAWQRVPDYQTLTDATS